MRGLVKFTRAVIMAGRELAQHNGETTCTMRVSSRRKLRVVSNRVGQALTCRMD